MARMVQSKEDLDRNVWTTEKVERVTEQIQEGYKVKEHPFWHGKVNWRKENITFEYTIDELNEIEKCKQNILYFANKYVYAMTDEGLQNITLRDYQEELVLKYKQHRFDVVLSSRQIGKTISAAIFLAWFVLFHYDKNTLIVANKGKTVKEIISKIKSVIQYLPFFLKPGMRVNNKKSMSFDNGCRIIGESASENPAIGFTIHLIYADEFAHINPNIVDSYYKSVFPTLSASKDGRMIITSTPNGRNKFFEIYNDAINGESQFEPTRVDWWQVPGRDEQWKANEIANLGSEEAFNQEYGNQFDVSTESLFRGSHLKRMKKTIGDFYHRQFDSLDAWEVDYEKLMWHKKFDTESLNDPNKYFVVGVDLSEGLGGSGDYTIFNIFQVVPMISKHIELLNTPTHIKDFFALKQVGMFRDNSTLVKEAAKFLYLLTYNIISPDRCKLCVEYNNYGREMIGYMPEVCENINDFGIESIVHFKHQINAIQKKPGLRLNSGNKSKYVVNLRSQFSKGRVFFTHNAVFREAQTFGKVRGKWKGQRAKDDVIMSSIQAASIFNTVEFQEMIEYYYDCLPKYKQDEIQHKLDQVPDNPDNMVDNLADVYDVISGNAGGTSNLPSDNGGGNVDVSFMD